MIDPPKDCVPMVCTLSLVAVVNVMIHCTGLPSRTMAFISQQVGMLVANFSQVSSSLDEESWITPKLLDYDPKVIQFWQVIPLSRVHFTSNDWLMQRYKCLVFLPQTGISLKGNPSSISPNMTDWVFAVIATKFNYSFCLIWLPSFPPTYLYCEYSSIDCCMLISLICISAPQGTQPVTVAHWSEQWLLMSFWQSGSQDYNIALLTY